MWQNKPFESEPLPGPYALENLEHFNNPTHRRKYEQITSGEIK